MKILITGATGFIGSALIEVFENKKCDIAILTRDRSRIKKSANDTKIEVFEDLDQVPCDFHCDAIINLAGAPISKRWTASYKKELIDSRIGTTRDIYSLVNRLEHKPTTLISASAVGYYGSQADTILDENAAPHDEFTHELCQQWEDQAMRLKEFGLKICIMRLGVVLGLSKGILKETVPIFKMGLGGKIGTGQQYLSWVHIDDVVRVIEFMLQANTDGGVYNLTSPHPVTNQEWTQSLAKAVTRPAFIPLPSFIVKLVFGEMGASLLLGGQKVLPTRLLAAGYKFKYPELSDALHDIFKKS